MTIWTPTQITAFVRKLGKTAEWKDVDQTTREWCRNASDVHAALNGCWFDPLAGGWVVWWIERYCRLYEGEWAGDPMRLRGLHSEPLDWDIPKEFDEEWAAARAAEYNACANAGDLCDWQYECTMRFFGWRVQSPRWNRPIRRFKKASVWVSKKSKKSPTMAAWCVYLLAGDGEAGQKVFVFAKDGAQARKNVGEHIRQMYEQSPELREQCSFNASLYRLAHLPTRSWLEPMSNANVRTAQAKEGINGSVFVDETHVVDRESIERVDRAGISRSEPVHAEFSTAGDNPDGYGKGQFDRAEKIESGEIVDQETFAAVYAVPQTATDQQILEDPERYARMANPAIGHTVDLQELLQDLNRSKENPNALSKCLMYRFNKWRFTASPWLPEGVWESRQSPKTLDDFAGQPCVLSLDLSRSTDSTCLCRVFAEPADQHLWRWDVENETWFCAFCGGSPDGCKDPEQPPTGQGECYDALQFHLFPTFWLPEEHARANADKADFLGWANRGDLQLIPGGYIEFGPIKRAIKEAAGDFDVQALFGDPYDLRPIIDWIAEQQFELEVVKFPQKPWVMGGPIDDLERMLVAGQVHHDGNDFMRWQVQNATIRKGGTGGKLIQKPRGRGDIRKVDGPVAAVMGVAGAIEKKIGTLGADSGAYSGPGTGMWD